MRWIALTLSSGVKNQALTGESGNRKLPSCERMMESREVKGTYKKNIAVMRVSVPVMAINLEESWCELCIARR